MELNRFWKFKTDPDGVGEEKKWYKKMPDDCTDIFVPSCWNNEMGLYSYEGKAWYFTDIYHHGGTLKIKFNSVINSAKVYLDSKLICEHYGGHSAFCAYADVECGKHFLCVVVENEYNMKDTMPLSFVDWHHWGGINRSVEIFSYTHPFIDGMKISYDADIKNKCASVLLNVILKGDGFKDYTLKINGKEHSVLRLAPGENKITLQMDKIKLWDTKNPYMYEFSLESEDDYYMEKTGFRKIEISGSDILLNGKKVYLKGINRHEEHPEWGFAFPEKLMKKDIDILLDLGVNCVRASHYPNSKAFLDLCDEYGILVWSEIPLWQYHEEQMTDDILISRAKSAMREMIEERVNHPSIIIWGLHNECDTDTKAGYDFSKILYGEAKKCDDSRLITYATHRSETDICFDFCDIISINRYVGWYEGKIGEWDRALDKIFSHIKETGNEKKPVFISEFGAAGIYGHNCFEDMKWTENYQSELLKDALETFKKRDIIKGTFVWQFADIRGSAPHIMTRARGFNNKGILNEYREPKTAYYTVKTFYDKIK